MMRKEVVLNKLFTIIQREFRERVTKRSFLAMAFIGPLLILGFLFLTFLISGSEKNKMKVLVADPMLITDSYIVTDTNAKITYEFINDYVLTEEFRKDPKYASYDALMEVNEKVMTNGQVKFLYRKHPGTGNLNRIRLEIERRLDELKIMEFTNLDVNKYRQIRKPLSFKAMDLNTMEDSREKQLAGYVGIFFAIVIFLFILLYGVQVMRGVLEEKSNRIIEVLVSSVKPIQVMMGKILGIGFAGLLQFTIWIILIGVGLYFIRINYFPNMLIPENLVEVQMSADVAAELMNKQLSQGSSYNDFVNLVYEGIDFKQMIGVFFVFFTLGYLLFASLFAIVGAAINNESEGQQFLVLILIPLIVALGSCFMIVENPEGKLSFWFSMIPFTSPIVVMVRACMGYGPEAFGELWEFYFSIIILLFSSVLCIWLASRIYRNGVLSYGKKIRLSQLLRWLK
jgi:ABC-2 type transport system permease protein